MAMKTLIDASSASSGAAIVNPRGSKHPTIRFLPSSGTYVYVVRAALTPDESPATGHLISGPTTVDPSASTIVACGTSGGAPINAHALYVGYSSLSGGTMSVFYNDGEDGP